MNSVASSLPVQEVVPTDSSFFLCPLLRILELSEIMEKLVLMLVVFTSGISLMNGQRPTYAGSSPKGRPELASRFKDPNDESSSTIRVYNRLGAAEGTTLRIPIDARGDGELVDRLSQWPREQRPFWLLNADHIEQHRNNRPGSRPTNNNSESNRNQQQQQATASRNGAVAADDADDVIPVRADEPRSLFLSTLLRT